MTALDQVMHTLAELRPTYTNEADLQTAIADALAAAGVFRIREHSLSAHDRIDLYLPGLRIGIEVKIAGDTAAVERQLRRYAASPQIHALVLVTTRASHSRMPLAIHGKPIRVHSLIGAGL